MSDRPGAISTALVLDSTAPTANWLLRGSAFSALRTIDGLRVAVPAVVLFEVEANHERAVAESDHLLEKVLRERYRLGFPSQDLREGSHPDYVARLKDRLD